MSFQLLPKEKLINSYPCKHRRNLNGKMHITNIRVCWIPDGDANEKSNEVDIPMSEIDVAKHVQSVDQDQRSVLMIKTDVKPQTFRYFELFLTYYYISLI
jgi:hypothetical protein